MTQDESQRPDDVAADPASPIPAEEGRDAAAPSTQQDTGPDLLSPGDMLVTLDFHLPGRTVSLAEAAAWTEGGIIALPDASLDPDLPITVRNGDRVIARGRLVRLDDCFGVRIDETFLRR